MFDKAKFKYILQVKNKSIKDIANLLGVSTQTVYRKMDGRSDFYRSEIELIRRYLELESAWDIFFAEERTDKYNK